MSNQLTIQKKIALFSAVLDGSVANRVQRNQKKLGHCLLPIIQKSCDIGLSNLRAKQTALPILLESWRLLKTEQNKKNSECGHLFNPLAFLPIGETTHSLLLGDLLDPKGSHGQDKLLLCDFLDRLGVPEPGSGDWMISIEQGKVDLCLSRRSPASVIVIENKSNMAIDQPNQLYRYWHANIHKLYPTLDYSSNAVKQSFQIIYMPPTAEKLPAPHSLQRPASLASLNLPETLDAVGVTVKICSYRDLISAWLEQCVEIVPPENYRLKAHLQFYRELWT